MSQSNPEVDQKVFNSSIVVQTASSMAIPPPLREMSHTIHSRSQFPACQYTRIASLNSGVPDSLKGLSLGKTIGKGSFAEVKGVYCHSRKRLMALKTVTKATVSEEYLHKFLPREIELLRGLSPHFCMIATHSIVETDQHVFFLMDLAQNGDLHSYIRSRQNLPEHEARFMMGQIVRGVLYLHSKCIAHRDLKCANILLSARMDVKIADFGFAINVSGRRAVAACGSYAFAAPELFDKSVSSYDAFKADIWSLGVVLYAMVCGRLVFGTDVQKVSHTTRSHIHFPDDMALSEPFKDLVVYLLRHNPRQRLSCEQIDCHTWMTAGMSLRPGASLPRSPVVYTVESLGIQFNRCNALANSLASPAQGNPLSSRPVRFLRKLASRVYSTLQPRDDTANNEPHHSPEMCTCL